ncbi:MAG: type IV pilus assembly protein PilM, partial [Candidatus Omnitrophica bacterium]|nr:type IV pilus assembly protein PilM [Candidatus Omnitrophota bacterium]
MSTSIGLDIGWRTIKLVQLEQSAKKIHLVKAGIHLLPFKEKETETGRTDAVIQGLTQLLSEMKIPSRSHFNVAVSGQSVFIRSIQVIAVSHEKLRQHIRFEAEQQIPFALNEVLWDYCVVNAGKEKLFQKTEKNSQQWKVVLAAIKKNLVDRQMELIQKTKGRCHLIDVGPVAFYNSVFFLEPEFFRQPVVLLDMGARGTHLVIAGEDEIWIRSFPLGADRLTQTVAETIRSSFNEAEVLKQKTGIESSQDAAEQKAVEAMKPAVTGLVEEIQRSIEYYHTQVPGGAKRAKPQKMVLGGGGALLKGIVPLLQEKLGVPVSLWPGFQKIQSKNSFNGNQLQLTTAMGLALRGLVHLPIELNLLREEVERRFQKRALQFYGGGSLMLSLAILGIAVQSNRQDYRGKEVYLEELKKTIKTYQSYEPKIKELEIRNDLLKGDVKALY